MTAVDAARVVDVTGVSVRIGPTLALAPVDLEVRAGEVLVLHGRSGSGKSTLLGLLAGWHDVSTGRLDWATALTERERRRWHRTAFVPQSLALLDELSLTENVALAAVLMGAGWPAARAAALERLATLAIDDLGDRRPDEVSFGQQQRAAVARALVVGPDLVLADEPTAHLDPVSTGLVVHELRRAADAGTAVVVASHDPYVVAAADRTVELHR